MRLKHLKIIGFKSFVDPTILEFPSQLIGIIGPNGCGKSNIIDAIRWVIGEAAAKNLRGESMTDVIFNGSASRRAVGQASVELVFDNHIGRLKGEYASYQDIAVKRLITRDGHSTYFLNGTRCRRRDIMDIFLGTGATSRGYSIISQGTVSKIIEAKPEELRLFIEEAAGVSKYKERRRETLGRIQSTQQNIDRSKDISAELEKQLQRLMIQAKTTERYQALKQQERLAKLSINAFKWHNFEKEEQEISQQLAQSTFDHKQQVEQLSKDTQAANVLKEQISIQQDQLETTQINFYKLATEIERIKTSHLHQKQEKKRLEAALFASTQAITRLDSEHVTEQQQLESCCLSITGLKADLNRQQLTSAKNKEKLAEQQELLSCLHKQTEALHINYSSSKQAIEVGKVKKDYAVTTREAIYHKFEIIEQQEQQISDDYQQLLSSTTSESLIHLQQEKIELDKQYHALIQQEAVIIEKTNQLQLLLESSYCENRKILNNKTIIETQMMTLLPPKNEQQNNHTNDAYVYQLMSVDPIWQQACESVLGGILQAKVIDKPDTIYSQYLQSKEDFESFTTENSKISSQTNRLRNKITGVIPNSAVDLETIITVSTLAEALQQLPVLNKAESIITADGFWLNNHWMVKLNSSKKSLSLLTLQTDLKACLHLLDKSESSILMQECEIKALQQQKTDTENSKRILLQQQNELQGAINSLKNTLEQQNKLRQTLERNKQQLADERADLELSLEGVICQIDRLSEQLTQESTRFQVLEQSLKSLNLEKEQQNKATSALRLVVEQASRIEHQLQLELGSRQSEREYVEQSLLKIKQQRSLESTSQDELNCLLQTLVGSDNTNTDELIAKMNEYKQLENHLNQQRIQLKQHQFLSGQLDEETKKKEQQLKVVEDRYYRYNMRLQALNGQKTSLGELLNEQNLTFQELLEVDIRQVSLSEQETQLGEITKAIGTLGPINLAALEEFHQETQRKQALDGQLLDLENALLTLELAIKKIDKKTITRIQETFTAVNQAFSLLFPRLFGGGTAQLTLTCDNLLEAGIVIMAQPPGKRNSTIYLLSGGEKALTAVALIFAIFQLNPSPFCLLDEVDAPLDDTNITRFCSLVKEMSEQVQFILVTHSKITMELADNLTGVTMQEAGVSRLVSVNVNQALAIVE